MKKGLWLPVIGLSVAVLSCSGQTAKSNTRAYTTVNFPSRDSEPKENPLNTVTTTGADGTQYKLVQIGDDLPKFYVNNRLVAVNELDRYSSLIGRLQPVLWERQKASAQANRTDELSRQESIVNDLVTDHIVKAAVDVLSFRLTANGLIVNDKPQPYTLFERYAKKYIKNTGNVYTFNQPSE